MLPPIHDSSLAPQAVTVAQPGLGAETYQSYVLLIQTGPASLVARWQLATSNKSLPVARCGQHFHRRGSHMLFLSRAAMQMTQLLIEMASTELRLRSKSVIDER